MKRRLAIALGLLALGAWAAPDFAALGKAVVGQMAAGQFNLVEARYTPTVAAALPPGRLAAIWKQLESQAGAFASITSVSVVDAGGGSSAVVTCKFAKATLNLAISFDGDGRMGGLHIVPGPPVAVEAWSPPPYAAAASFHEEAVTVGTAPWTLPGTLTLPNGAGPFAALVLVHGSGPNDADESDGADKPFKDLAWGLATRGIAVLRYVKRTRQYGAVMASQMAGFTVKQEAVDDARAAVALLAERADINPRKIYVLGHSEGGYLAPRIAAGDAEIAGIISLAGSTRPLIDSAIDQLKYFDSLHASPGLEAQIAAAEATQRQLESPALRAGDTVSLLGAPMPGSYFLDLRGYDPGTVAAGLKRPVLVLQGGRDYQVTEKDFDGWKTALAHDPQATFKFYPTLTHVFTVGSVPPTPADYQTPGHVDAAVIGDIAAWVGN